METFENSLIIQQPIEAVFDFVSDFENMPKWNYFVIDAKNVGEKPLGVGTRFKQVRKTDQQRYRIVAYEPNRLVAVETEPPTEPLTMSFILEPVPEGTRLIDRWEFDPGVPGPLAWLAARRVKAAVAENLEKLKELLETGRVQLQDGREVVL
jgi:uncharacterized protein YndB with AHSA1/START domain